MGYQRDLKISEFNFTQKWSVGFTQKSGQNKLLKSH